MAKYDTRNRFQRAADVKGSTCCCITTALFSLILTTCLVALSLSGKLGLTNNQSTSLHPIRTAVDASLWQMPSMMPSKHIASSAPSDRPSTLPSLLPSILPSADPSRLPSSVPSSDPSSVPSGNPSNMFSSIPSSFPSSVPSFNPTENPSVVPTLIDSAVPSWWPTAAPSTMSPSREPSLAPTLSPPSFEPSVEPSLDPTELPLETVVTYEPGNLVSFKLNMWLSQGLTARRLARKNEKVVNVNGESSTLSFHERPDFGATFPLEDGGWIYVSNSEMKEQGQGGVGALRFDKDGNVLSYDMILNGTTMNCGGGRTPWGSWVSCEEIAGNGQAYQVDPEGKRPPAPITMGLDGGRFESFSFDARDPQFPRYFLTEDLNRGALRRFTPDSPDWTDPWSMLHISGKLDFLVLDPTTGTFTWTTDLNEARISGAKYYPDCEGIDVDDGILYVVSKSIKQLFILDLDAQTYISTSTQQGVFDGGPDQVKRIVGGNNNILYFTEEGGRLPGVHGRNGEGRFFTILEGDYNDETTGLSFSPDGKFMYVAFQETGLLFEISREDGLAFNGRTLNVKYHNQATAVTRKS